MHIRYLDIHRSVGNGQAVDVISRSVWIATFKAIEKPDHTILNGGIKPQDCTFFDVGLPHNHK